MTMANHVLTRWEPENKDFWQNEGRAIARRNLWISIPALLLAFAIWQVWSVAVVNLPNIGFKRGFAGCQTAAEYFKAHGFIVKNPIAGDIVFYDWQGDGRYDHAGIFLKHNDNDTFLAIEGNTSVINQSNGGSVMFRNRHYKNCIFVHITLNDSAVVSIQPLHYQNSNNLINTDYERIITKPPIA